MPSGIAFRDDALYVAATSEVLRYDDILDHLEAPPKPVVVSNAFPADEHHGWKFIAFGPDGKLYVPVGAPCNVCDRSGDDQRYATIMRMNPDGTGLEVFASGVRNTVGFDWHPETKKLWFTDNGRDHLGDDVPPDELNHAPGPGLHFGFPYCHGDGLADPEFGKDKPCDNYVKPAMALGAHVAAIGMRFYTGNMFPAEYRNQIFIAEHGSWNRTEPVGYRVTVVKLDGNRAVGYQPFADGWLEGIVSRNGAMTIAKKSARPADVLVMPDGALLVADDHAGVIYRIYYRKA
jgi:glucose/arabinose dehydrogenase